MKFEGISEELQKQITNEGNLVWWTDEATSLDCIIIRHPLYGHLCGYVVIPEGSELRKIDAMDLEVSVHGGVTYSGELKSVPGRYLIGFDCAHCDDISPGLTYDLNVQSAQYRDMEYVKQETTGLATQFKAMLDAERVAA